jgi:hypothetical protein
MLDGGELTHVRADLREDGLGDGRREPGDGDEIHARDAHQMGTHLVAGLVLRGDPGLTRGNGTGGSSLATRGCITLNGRAQRSP